MTEENVPVLTVDLDWASDEGLLPPQAEGILIIQTGEANGWPVYRITGSVPRLVRWLAEHYVGGIDHGQAMSLGDLLESARFTKVADAFTPSAR